MMVNFGGFLPLSLSDWPGKTTSVTFLRGCPLRCLYCHNQWLQSGEDRVRTDYVAKLVNRGVAQVPRVVFSGGEPLMQHEALMDIIERLDPSIEVGLETSGVYAGALYELLERSLIDHVFLDIKAHSSSKYAEVTGGVMDGDKLMEQVRISLGLCDEHKVPVTARTTVYQGYPNEAEKELIRDLINGYNTVEELVIQNAVVVG